jgi:aminoglycoside phosphotransferase (APT) family kinase protein
VTEASATETAWVSDRLIAYVRRHVAPDAGYADEPQPLSGGFETKTYAFHLAGADAPWDGELVLRIFPRTYDPLMATRDEILHEVLAACEFPAPRVVHACADPGPLGGAFVVAERFAGRDMFSAYFPMRARRMMPDLAAVQATLHALDATPFEQALAGHVESEALLRMTSLDGQIDDMRRRIEASALGGLVPGLAWLMRSRPPSRHVVICHGDLHPLNLLVASRIGERVSSDTCSVIDWSLATLAPAEYDVGSTRMLLSFAPAGLPFGLEQAASVWQRRVLARSYIAAYRKRRDIDDDAVAYYEAWRCLRALCWAGESRRAELDDVGVHRRGPWDAARVSSRVAARFREISGVRVVLPT